MMKKLLKLLCIFLLMTVLTLLFVGCSKNNTDGESNSDASGSTADNSEGVESKKELDPVALVMYVIGDKPLDMPKVLSKLNKMTKEDLNATVNIKFIPWGDVTTKYPLLLASGEGFDLIFAASWRNYTIEARKGSFLALNDLLPEYAPKLWEHIPEQAWGEAKVDGNIYAVPKNELDYNAFGFVMREDLRKEYNVPEIKKFEDMELYFQAIKENEEGMIPYHGGSTRKEAITYHIESRNEFRLAPFVGSVEYDINNPVPENLFSRWFSDEYRDHWRLAKKWADKGYWTNDVLSNNIDQKDSFKQGRSSVCIMNWVGFNGLYREMQKSQPDWELGFFDFTEGVAKVENSGYMGDAMSLNWNAKNPERALMLLEKLHMDKRYYMLTYYGVEGEHYVLTDNGQKVALPEDIEDTNLYPWDSYSWAWNESMYTLSSMGDYPLRSEIEEDFANRNYSVPLVGFTVDQSNINAELSAVKQVEVQYGHPLNWGLMENVDEAVNILHQKLEEAGIEQVIEEQRQQLADWLESKK